MGIKPETLSVSPQYDGKSKKYRTLPSRRPRPGWFKYCFLAIWEQYLEAIVFQEADFNLRSHKLFVFLWQLLIINKQIKNTFLLRNVQKSLEISFKIYVLVLKLIHIISH